MSRKTDKQPGKHSNRGCIVFAVLGLIGFVLFSPIFPVSLAPTGESSQTELQAENLPLTDLGEPPQLSSASEVQPAQASNMLGFSFLDLFSDKRIRLEEEGAAQVGHRPAPFKPPRSLA